ncbi:hypothetical protein CXB51_024480 [Gossypium anomalum]|uniref:Amino acid transporter transmembrane domain-containing protein n=1 Tax=Gossypium anomalum TaxID=47600 RepID=A0A8J5Y649_9ROSI|nr:hypothetical protein CXB51_024480 [Gossypium anomalum]
MAILDLLVVIPIMTNAYVFHFNVQPIYNELEGRSPQKMNQVGRITTALCVVVYASTVISGSLALTEILLVLIYIGSTMIPNIWTAFKFTGATTTISLGFTFPALIALTISQQEESMSLSRVENFCHG